MTLVVNFESGSDLDEDGRVCTLVGIDKIDVMYVDSARINLVD